MVRIERRRSAADERQVEVHLTCQGSRLHAKTGCLTAALLKNSGFTVAEMIDLNQKVQLLRQGMRNATELANAS